jgi:predicted RND superfamily exporter protein
MTPAHHHTPGAPRRPWIDAIAVFALGRPWLVLGLVLLVSAAAAAVLPRLGMTTSRTEMVSADNPYQARMVRFQERFGHPDMPVVLIEGGEPEDRRAVVDALARELAGDPLYAGRVLARFDAAAVAEILLLDRPSVLGDIVRALPEGTSPAEAVEGGLPTLMKAMEARIEAALDSGEADGAIADPGAGAGGGDNPAAKLDDGAKGLATAARALIDDLQGRDPLRRFVDVERRAGMGRSVDEYGYLTARDGQYHVVVTFPPLAGDELEDNAPAVAALRAARDRALEGFPEGITADVTGLPAISVDELSILGRSTITTTVVAGVLILAIFFGLFRSLRQTIFALLPLSLGTIITLAFVVLMYGRLNLITSSFIAVLLGLGVDFSVHLLSRFNEQVRAGVERKTAMRDAMSYSGPGIATGAITTAIAFLTTSTTEFTAYAELGIITAFGLLTMLALTFVMLPALISLQQGVNVPPEPPVIGRLGGGLVRARRAIVVVSAITALVGGLSISAIPFNARYFDFVPKQVEAARSLLKLEGDPEMSPVHANMTARSVEEARAFAAAARALPSVAGVQSASDLLPPLAEDGRLDALRAGLAAFGRAPDFAALAAAPLTPEVLRPRVQGLIDVLDEVRFALRQANRPTAAIEDAKAALVELRGVLEGLDALGRERLGRLHGEAAALLQRAWSTATAVAERGAYVPADLPALFQERFASKDRELLAVYVTPAGDFWDREVAAGFSRDLEAINPEAAGLAMNHHAHEQMIIDGFRMAALYAAGLIFVLLVLDFRRVDDALLAAVPMAIGWGWMLGVMALVQLPFDVANIITLPLVLGIGIDAGVHVVHRARESATVNAGVAKLDDILRGTGGAVMVSSLTTMAGFAGLVAGEYLGSRNIGIAMVIGVGTSLIASVVVLPALLVWLRRAA